jgi:septal ring factor EnvC (AmiA/AmiB activator)
VENSPLVLAISQIIILIAQAVAYLRSKQDVARTKTEMGVVSLDIRTAKDTAESAKRAVETIELSHYKALLAKYEGVVLELVDAQKAIKLLRAEVESLRESIASVNNKLASRERADKSAAKKAAREDVPEMPTEPGSGVDELVRNGMAFPLFQQPAAPAAKGHVPGFGRAAR